MDTPVGRNYTFFPNTRGEFFCWRRWPTGTILASLVLDSTRFWVRISARTPIRRNITIGGDITGGVCPGAGFPSCYKSIYRVSEDNFRGSACVSEWMLISVKKRWGLAFHNLNGCIRTISLNKKIKKIGGEFLVK
jgi:hypothetical protein